MTDLTKNSLDQLLAGKEPGKPRPPADDVPSQGLPEGFWDNLDVKAPSSKKSVELRVDADILEHFKKDGAGHEARMHTILRAYVDAKTKKVKKAS